MFCKPPHKPSHFVVQNRRHTPYYTHPDIRIYELNKRLQHRTEVRNLRDELRENVLSKELVCRGAEHERGLLFMCLSCHKPFMTARTAKAAINGLLALGVRSNELISVLRSPRAFCERDFVVDLLKYWS